MHGRAGGTPAPPIGGTMPSTANPEVAQRQPELLGQTVVVIGGSSGIGLETARRARAEGADVILTGRNPERLQHAALELGALSTAAFDATDPAPLSASLLGDDLERRRDQLRATLPIQRVVGPADVAALPVHIMTNTALTGATHDIGGGQQLVPGSGG